jgi:hypothetical protein
MQHKLVVAGAALALAAPAALQLAQAKTADTDELASIRRQIEQMKQDYEQRIKALEERLKRTEAAVQEARSSALKAQTAAQEVAAAPQPPGPSAGSPSAFNPAIGVVLDGAFTNLSRDPKQFAIPGFALGAGVGPGDRGFSLGESELNFNANVDNLFFGNLTLAIPPEGGIDVEEAYFQTLGLPYGLITKGGRFFSRIGYLNEVHAHAWDFVDQPLPYQAMLDNQFDDDGVQVRWVAPTDLFVELGGELFRGDSFPAGGAANHGIGARTAFIHVGGDIGTSHSWRAGLSQLRVDAQNRETGGRPDVFTGDSNLTIADFVWKWAPEGNPHSTNFKLQGEYFHREEDGQFNGSAYSGKQDGWYVQGVYQFVPRWRLGYRYDQVSAGDVAPIFAGTTLDNQGQTPRRNTLMVDFSNSEFSRLRLQYTRDETQPEVDNQWFMQYIMSLGAHGAHQF